MDALIGNFALYDDVNKVYDILKGHRKLTLLCEEKQNAAKTAIKQLQKKVSDLQERKEELVSQNEQEMREENDRLKEEVSVAVPNVPTSVCARSWENQKKKKKNGKFLSISF